MQTPTLVTGPVPVCGGGGEREALAIQPPSHPATQPPSQPPSHLATQPPNHHIV